MQKSTLKKKPWLTQFAIRSEEEFDFMIGDIGFLSIGVTRKSPPEFRRRLLAAAISYKAGLQSIDYAFKRYVDRSVYENAEITLGDEASDYLLDCGKVLKAELKALHTQRGLTFGIFSAEMTLFKMPDLLDTARIVANRGLLLEVAPILRLGLEMISWAAVAFHLNDEEKVKRLQANGCVPQLKTMYQTAGRVYGHLSKLCHWEYDKHSMFIDIQNGKASITKAKAEHRAISLVLCLIIFDILIEVVRQLYSTRANRLIKLLQGRLRRDEKRKAHQIVTKISDFSQIPELQELKGFLC